MELRHPGAPEQSQAAVRSALSELAEAGRFNTPTGTSVSGAGLALRPGLQVFLLGLDDLRAGRGLEAARPIGWRYLVEDAGRPVALAETVVNREGRHVLGHVNYGPFVSGIDGALRRAEALEGRDVVRPALLHVPALYFLGLWLQSTDRPAEDTLMPIAPVSTSLEANRAYAAPEVLRVLTETRRDVDHDRDTR